MIKKLAAVAAGSTGWIVALAVFANAQTAAAVRDAGAARNPEGAGNTAADAATDGDSRRAPRGLVLLSHLVAAERDLLRRLAEPGLRQLRQRGSRPRPVPKPRQRNIYLNTTFTNVPGDVTSVTLYAGSQAVNTWSIVQTSAGAKANC